jgi:hypothetical protein
MSAITTATAVINVSQRLLTALTKLVLDFTVEIIKILAVKHKFDADDAIKMLELDKTTSVVERKKAAAAGGGEAKEAKFKYIIPFNPATVNNAKCQCLTKDWYLQCKRTPIEGTTYCKTCTGHGSAEKYGTVADRLKSELYEYKSPSGGEVKFYSSYIKRVTKATKTNPNPISVEDLMELLRPFEIPEEHFTTMAPKKAKKGKFPKSDAVEELDDDDNDDDIFGADTEEEEEVVAVAAAAAAPAAAAAVISSAEDSSSGSETEGGGNNNEKVKRKRRTKQEIADDKAVREAAKAVREAAKAEKVDAPPKKAVAVAAAAVEAPPKKVANKKVKKVTAVEPVVDLEEPEIIKTVACVIKGTKYGLDKKTNKLYLDGELVGTYVNKTLVPMTEEEEEFDE